MLSLTDIHIRLIPSHEQRGGLPRHSPNVEVEIVGQRIRQERCSKNLAKWPVFGGVAFYGLGWCGGREAQD